MPVLLVPTLGLALAASRPTHLPLRAADAASENLLHIWPATWLRTAGCSDGCERRYFREGGADEGLGE
eukprot:3932435-Rhodomonas_salina.4